jgi:hypothetical protein
VESEKTALIMANYYGNLDKQLWLACGGLKHLQLDSIQPLIDQGRTIWLWPDKDGRDDWQQVCDKLGYDKCRVYTQFFDTCWTEEDGEKADVADIAVRMIRNPEWRPREKADVKKTETKQWNTDEPFLDSEEFADPKVHEWRMKCAVHSSGWGKYPQSNVKGVKTVAEVIEQNPIIKKLLQ